MAGELPKDLAIAKQRLLDTDRDCNISAAPDIQGTRTFFQMFISGESTEGSSLVSAATQLISEAGIPADDMKLMQMEGSRGFSIDNDHLANLREHLSQKRGASIE